MLPQLPALPSLCPGLRLAEWGPAQADTQDKQGVGRPGGQGAPGPCAPHSPGATQRRRRPVRPGTLVTLRRRLQLSCRPRSKLRGPEVTAPPGQENLLSPESRSCRSTMSRAGAGRCHHRRGPARRRASPAGAARAARREPERSRRRLAGRTCGRPRPEGAVAGCCADVICSLPMGPDQS